MLACIWDYYGIDSKGTAEHFEKHLKEFIHVKNVENCITGVRADGKNQAFVWCAGEENSLDKVITALKPKHFIHKEDFTEFGILI
ncbi:hypothetical protein [Fluviispira sanaruensis]|uniref:Uncharacterized protein n=1 Tax=Fluviispira sanaruensis TaxID=2493639 RepID=A0A4P2VQA5_FLUSA|nr:hypothetical protein [Fluviispira sanaruensis]BBH54454.1 hypothetical protein JCM31447_29250 [Fluviispira sanaruensis]